MPVVGEPLESPRGEMSTVRRTTDDGRQKPLVRRPSSVVRRPSSVVRRPSSVGVLHLIDTLAAGGSERVAVNFVNHLPRERYSVHLCATRRSGPLQSLLRPDVHLFLLGRASRFDIAAILRL